VTLLLDAHDMEVQSRRLLRSQAADPRKHIEARRRFEAHLLDTERHVERIREALQYLGSAPSGAGRVMPSGNLTGHFFSDPHVKAALTDFAAEQFEVAAYTALVSAAEYADEPEIARLCRLNRGEDGDMAEWLDGHIAIVITERMHVSGGGRRPRLPLSAMTEQTAAAARRRFTRSFPLYARCRSSGVGTGHAVLVTSLWTLRVCTPSNVAGRRGELARARHHGPLAGRCVIAAGQRAEHYDMAAYGALVAWTPAMGRTDAAKLLQQTLDEEKPADKKLSALAEGGINQRAASSHSEEAANRSARPPAVPATVRQRLDVGNGAADS